MTNNSSSRMTRKIYPMPDYVLTALEQENLFSRYHQRPPYQQNDYIGWITRAKKPETQEKRLQQMLSELTSGDLYMKMVYKTKR